MPAERQRLLQVRLLVGSDTAEEFEPDRAGVRRKVRLDEPRQLPLHLGIAFLAQELHPQGGVNELHRRPDPQVAGWLGRNRFDPT